MEYTSIFAALLASRGFACLAIAYFGYGDLPKAIETLDLEYFEEAVEYLLEQPGVIPDRCGVLSSSKGSNLGLAMGIYLKKVTAVVSIGGKLIGDMTLTFRGRELWKAVKLGIRHFRINLQLIVTANESALKKLYTHDHPCMPPCETAPDDTHFLLIAGDEDGMRTKVDIDAMMQRMNLHGRGDHCHTIIYEGTGHIIEPPYNTHAAYSSYNLGPQKLIVVRGGHPKGTLKAQEDCWKNVRKFMEMHVRDRSEWFQQYLGRVRREEKL